jgi:hypothetical protein
MDDQVVKKEAARHPQREVRARQRAIGEPPRP